MNIYEKLQDCRVKLAKSDLKKSGENGFSHYAYFELGDFLPKLTEIMAEDKLTSVITFDDEVATLTLIDCEKPEDTIVFTSPMREANLKGTHPIQNLGAVETYSRRYLYTIAFDIVESDTLDSVQKPTNAWVSSQAQPYQGGYAQPPQEQQRYFCADCGKEFTGFSSKNGTFYNAGQQFHMAEKNAIDGKARCFTCLKNSNMQRLKN